MFSIYPQKKKNTFLLCLTWAEHIMNNKLGFKQYILTYMFFVCLFLLGVWALETDQVQTPVLSLCEFEYFYFLQSLNCFICKTVMGCRVAGPLKIGENPHNPWLGKGAVDNMAFKILLYNSGQVIAVPFLKGRSLPHREKGDLENIRDS